MWRQGWLVGYDYENHDTRKREIAAKYGEHIGLLKANESLAAHKRELADFQRRYDECVRKFNEADIERVRLRDEVASLRALVKELADALEKVDDMCDGYMCKFFTSTKHCSKCKYLEKCQTGIAHNALKDNEREIARARKMIGGGK